MVRTLPHDSLVYWEDMTMTHDPEVKIEVTAEKSAVKALVGDKTAIKLYIPMLLSDYFFQPKNRLDWEFHHPTAIKRPLPANLVPLNITG